MKTTADKFNSFFLCLPAVLAAIIFTTGCQSVKTVRMYNGSEASPDQLATLSAPWCIGLRTVDGASAPSTLSDELRLLLKPGVHTVEARYIILYPLGKGDTEKITSDYIPLTFTAEAGKVYTICSKDPRTLEATRKYAAHVSLWIEERSVGATKGTVVKAPPPPAIPPIITGTKAENPDIQAQLLKLWEQAGDQDRKAFLDKIRK